MPAEHSKEPELHAKAISRGRGGEGGGGGESKNHGSTVMMLNDMMRICQSVIRHLVRSLQQGAAC